MSRSKTLFWALVSGSASWLIVVLIASVFMEDSAIDVGLGAAIGGPLLAICFGAQISKEDQNGSVGWLAAHLEMPEAELIKPGLRKGCLLGGISVAGVALIPIAIFAADSILTAYGK
jgi:hypothetical protein